MEGVTCNAAAYPAGCLSKDVPFRKRALAVYRSCIAKLPKGGNIQACFGSYQACVREAFGAACVEPELEAQCERIIASCREHGATPSFDAAGCAHILGALEPTLRDDTARRLANDENPAHVRCSRVWILPGFPATPFFPN
jgi:hypothetical protein